MNTIDNQTLTAALRRANAVCRSMAMITERRGEKTNWPAFAGCLATELAHQRALLHPAPSVDTVPVPQIDAANTAPPAPAPAKDEPCIELTGTDETLREIHRIGHHVDVRLMAACRVTTGEVGPNTLRFLRLKVTPAALKALHEATATRLVDLIGEAVTSPGERLPERWRRARAALDLLDAARGMSGGPIDVSMDLIMDAHHLTVEQLNLVKQLETAAARTKRMRRAARPDASTYARNNYDPEA